MKHSAISLLLAATVFAQEPLKVTQNLCCEEGHQAPPNAHHAEQQNCGGCGGFPCICKGLFGGRFGGASHGSPAPCNNGPVRPPPFGPPPQHPTLTPSTVYSTVTHTHTETGQVTHIDISTSVETYTTTVTSTHLSTNTEVLHPEKTFTLTRTDSYLVWPAYTYAPGGQPSHPIGSGPVGPAAGSGISNCGNTGPSGPTPETCTHGQPHGRCAICH